MTRYFLLMIAVVTAGTFPAFAQPLIQTSAKQAIVVDYETGTVLLEKNADERMPTSSMSKVMTMYMVFDALKKGDISLESKFTVSEKAWRMQGSKMFVELGKQIAVEDLARGVIVQSGNDATIVLAEGLAGSEAAFAANMNARAKDLGMAASNFTNASGWPDPEHYSTARDLAALGVALVREFPEYYAYYAEKEFTYNDIKQGNRNPLLYKNIGADGIKTGHTEAAGYGLIGSGTLSGRRVVLVVNGLADEKERASESAKLLEWGLQMFENKKIVAAGGTLENARVVLGTAQDVPIVAQDDITATIPKAAIRDYKVSITYREPLVAPVAKGQEVGTLTVEIPNAGKIERPLYAGADVPRLGPAALALARAKLLLGGGG